MARALVTGGAGFLGSHIADALSEQGFEVVVFDRQESPHLRNGQQMVIGDLLEPGSLAAAAAECDCMFHLAALSDLEQASADPVAATRHNVLGTVQALEAARQGGVKRFLFASTVYVYSRAGGFYRCSKQACEAYVEEYERQFGLGYTILRYGSLYGPRATEANGVYRLLRQALDDGNISTTPATPTIPASTSMSRTRLDSASTPSARSSRTSDWSSPGTTRCASETCSRCSRRSSAGRSRSTTPSPKRASPIPTTGSPPTPSVRESAAS